MKVSGHLPRSVWKGSGRSSGRKHMLWMNSKLCGLLHPPCLKTKIKPGGALPVGHQGRVTLHPCHSISKASVLLQIFCGQAKSQNSRTPLVVLGVLPKDKLLLFSRSVVSDSLRSQGLQQARLPCPSLSSRVCSNSCPFELVMPSNHLILCCPLLLLPSIFPSIQVFSKR